MPGSGRFRIVSVQEGIPPIGADIYDESAIKPVVSAGSGNVWILEELSGSEKYRITLDSAWFARQDDSNVVVDSSSSTQIWSIRSNGNGKYTIERDTPVWPNLGWTLDLSGRAPKFPVVLRVVELPTDIQLWRFIKLP
ncbi:hypothetical protein PAXINDRAFT_168505, partial [Paxillus involutus ATCC 200175]